MASQPFNVLDRSRTPAKTILFLAWPAVMEQLLQTMVGYVDTAMVGTLGVGATAAVAVSNPLAWLVVGLMNVVALGFSIQVARYVGEKNLDLARSVVRQGLLMTVIGGLGITILMQLLAGRLPLLLGAEPAVAGHATNYLRIVSLAYLFQFFMVTCSNIIRSTGDTRSPLQVNIAANLINICGNFLLIYPGRTITLAGRTLRIWGAGLGVEGAAAATAASFFLSGIALLAILLRKKVQFYI